MRKYPINKMLNQVPYFLGLPLNLGYLFLAVSIVILFSILLSGFSIIKLGILILCVALLYVVLTVLSHQSHKKTIKAFFSTKLTAIKNGNLKPFTLDASKDK